MPRPIDGIVAATANAAMDDSTPPRDVELVQQLRQQYQEIAQLAGALAHEIKNPLSVIGMNVELLAEELAEVDAPQARRALGKLDILQKQCLRLERMLDDFLRFARVRKLDLTPGSLNEQVDRVLDFFDAQVKDMGVEVLRYLDPDLPSILLDEQTLEAALVNLIKNALEAMSTGDQLIARTRLTKQGVALDLIDTGKGMDQNTAMHMFDAFYSTKEGGSGLGLPTARKVIEAHGARIHVQSELGRGTKFSIEFPTPSRIPADPTPPLER
ncbi:MAG TPA: ATP-binding protein [Pirellulaceae bacterium]